MQKESNEVFNIQPPFHWQNCLLYHFYSLTSVPILIILIRHLQPKLAVELLMYCTKMSTGEDPKLRHFPKSGGVESTFLVVSSRRQKRHFH